MGLLMRRRRPVMRLAAGAATATVAYQAGKRQSGQAGGNDEAQAAYAAPQQRSATAPLAGGGPADTTAQLAQLAQLHTSGSLSDSEFAAAKSKLLGV
jgi:hypothetical protein